MGDFTPPVGGAHAALWHGTAESMVDLHPSGMMSSRAQATDGTLQGGFFQLPSGITRAALWSGTAASLVDLNPAGASNSVLAGMAPGEQVGYATVPGIGSRAILWRGTPESAVDMHPPWLFGVSELRATCGSAQVGVVQGGTAGIWFGTPESFVDLAQFLPSGYSESVATSVAELNGTFYVGGYAYRAGTLDREAILWVGIPAPGTGPLLLAAGVLACRRRR